MIYPPFTGENGREDALDKLRPFIDFVIQFPTPARINAIYHEMCAIVRAHDEYHAQDRGWHTLDIRLHDEAMADTVGLVIERLFEAFGQDAITIENPILAHLLEDESIDWHYAMGHLEDWWYLNDALVRHIETKYWKIPQKPPHENNPAAHPLTDR